METVWFYLTTIQGQTWNCCVFQMFNLSNIASPQSVSQTGLFYVLLSKYHAGWMFLFVSSITNSRRSTPALYRVRSMEPNASNAERHSCLFIRKFISVRPGITGWRPSIVRWLLSVYCRALGEQFFGLRYAVQYRVTYYCKITANWLHSMMHVYDLVDYYAAINHVLLRKDTQTSLLISYTKSFLYLFCILWIWIVSQPSMLDQPWNEWLSAKCSHVIFHLYYP